MVHSNKRSLSDPDRIVLTKVQYTLQTVPSYLVLDVEHHKNLYDSNEAGKGGPDGELEEVAQIVPADAVVCEGAVVVHVEGTVLAPTAVVDGPTIAANPTLEAGIVNIEDLVILEPIGLVWGGNHMARIGVLSL